MKTRLGFVSNSSSSSFLLGIKDETQYVYDIKDYLKEEFGNLGNQVYNKFFRLEDLDRITEIKDDGQGYEMESERGQYHYFSDKEKYDALVKAGFTFYEIRLDNSSGDSLEEALYEYGKFELESDNTFIMPEN